MIIIKGSVASNSQIALQQESKKLLLHFDFFEQERSDGLLETAKLSIQELDLLFFPNFLIIANLLLIIQKMKRLVSDEEGDDFQQQHDIPLKRSRLSRNKRAHASSALGKCTWLLVICILYL